MIAVYVLPLGGGSLAGRSCGNSAAILIMAIECLLEEQRPFQGLFVLRQAEWL